MCIVAVDDGSPMSFAIWLTATTRSPRYRRIATRVSLASARNISAACPSPVVPSTWKLLRAMTRLLMSMCSTNPDGLRGRPGA